MVPAAKKEDEKVGDEAKNEEDKEGLEQTPGKEEDKEEEVVEKKIDSKVVTLALDDEDRHHSCHADFND